MTLTSTPQENPTPLHLWIHHRSVSQTVLALEAWDAATVRKTSIQSLSVLQRLVSLGSLLNDCQARGAGQTTRQFREPVEERRVAGAARALFESAYRVLGLVEGMIMSPLLPALQCLAHARLWRRAYRFNDISVPNCGQAYTWRGVVFCCMAIQYTVLQTRCEGKLDDVWLNEAALLESFVGKPRRRSRDPPILVSMGTRAYHSSISRLPTRDAHRVPMRYNPIKLYRALSRSAVDLGSKSCVMGQSTTREHANHAYAGHRVQSCNTLLGQCDMVVSPGVRCFPGRA